MFGLVLLPACLAFVLARSAEAPRETRRPTVRLLPEPERRAVAFLSREVPRWPIENHCFSCHNNGDAARALYEADRISGTVPAAALDATTRWLGRPDRWKHNGGEGPFNDPVLARVQFAAALATAVETGHQRDRSSLQRAADLLVEDQRPDGTWPIDAGDGVGSPASYANSLAAAVARRTLRLAGPQRYCTQSARIDDWMRTTEVHNVVDAAAILLGLDGAIDAPAQSQRRRCLELIRKGQSKEGGWGPYVKAPPEPFDTAVVLLALAPLAGSQEIDARRGRGRAFLVSLQQEDGGWPATTRPPGAESYAQRLSTTGWATLALLATPPALPATDRTNGGNGKHEGNGMPREPSVGANVSSGSGPGSGNGEVVVEAPAPEDRVLAGALDRVEQPAGRPAGRHEPRSADQIQRPSFAFCGGNCRLFLGHHATSASRSGAAGAGPDKNHPHDQQAT
jgi:hypothetical protein